MPQPKGRRRGEHLFWRKDNRTWYGWINVREVSTEGGEHFRRVKRSLGTTEIELARARLAEWERDSADPSATARKAARIGDVFDLYIEDRLALVAAGKRSEDSKTYYENFKKAWLLYAGRLAARTPRTDKDRELTQERRTELRTLGCDLALMEVDRAFRDGFITHRRMNGTGENTISKHLGSMKSAMMLAKVNGIWSGDLDVIFPPGFETGYVPKRISWTHEQADRVLAELAHLPHRRAQAEFVLATGAEERAVHNAMRHELDKVPIPLHGEKTKDRDRACFVVLPWQKAYLADAKKHMDGENGKAFTDWANSCRDLEAACLAADVPYASLHGLRHVFGGWALDDGLSMNTVGKALGHKDLRQLMLTYDNRDPKVIQWRAEQEAADRAHRPKLRAIKGGKANSKAAKGPTTRQRRSYEKKAATG